MIVDRLTKGTENNSLLRQFFAISSGNRNRVENGIHRHLFAFPHGNAQLLKRRLHLFT
ncbi:Uncharacterised protein [Shigella sonnei]|nr:Uncharacterised protein [Shigella sonnei]